MVDAIPAAAPAPTRAASGAGELARSLWRLLASGSACRRSLGLAAISIPNVKRRPVQRRRQNSARSEASSSRCPWTRRSRATTETALADALRAAVRPARRAIELALPLPDERTGLVLHQRDEVAERDVRVDEVQTPGRVGHRMQMRGARTIVICSTMGVVRRRAVRRPGVVELTQGVCTGKHEADPRRRRADRRGPARTARWEAVLSWREPG